MILGFAQLIDGDDPPPTLRQAASVEQILKAGWYLLELIDEILDLSQIDSGKLAIKKWERLYVGGLIGRFRGISRHVLSRIFGDSRFVPRHTAAGSVRRLGHAALYA